MAKISVIGAGSWGTALSCLFAKRSHEITLWVHDPALAEKIKSSRENPAYLPNAVLPPMVSITASLAEALHSTEYVVLAVPSQYMRPVVKEMVPHFSKNVKIISAIKGIEQDTLLYPTQILEQILPRELNYKLAALSGPTFAKEIAAGLPSAAVIASDDKQTAQELQHLLSNSVLRLYAGGDIIGAELGGALKNVMAIAAGICDGLKFGNNARAALITRGLSEMIRLGVSMGANPATFQGLSGLGDLILTCTGDLSRNRGVGLALGQGKTLLEIQQGMKMVAEGVATTKSSRQLAIKQGVDMPIIEQVHSVLFENKPPRQAVQDLMERKLKFE